MSEPRFCICFAAYTPSILQDPISCCSSTYSFLCVCNTHDMILIRKLELLWNFINDYKREGRVSLYFLILRLRHNDTSRSKIYIR